MHRFFLMPLQVIDGEVVFPGDISHQIARVLRLQVKDRVLIMDNSGKEYHAELTRVHPAGCRAAIIEVFDPPEDSMNQVHLFISITRREKFEWILQKATEIGAAGITPMITERSLVQSLKNLENKSERWGQIIREAAEQSQRTRLPLFTTPLRFQEAISMACREFDLAVIPWEGESSLRLKIPVQSSLKKDNLNKVAIFIGPEGGFSGNEINSANSAGILPVSLGKNILRMETAAVVAVSLVLYELGDLG